MEISSEKLRAMNECFSCESAVEIEDDFCFSCLNPDPEMIGDPHGIDQGFFNYPLVFDPIWKAKTCSNFSQKGGDND